MNFTNENEAAAQSLLLTENSAEEFSGAIRNARMALKSGSINSAIDNLEKASRRAGEVGDPRATELANFANALAHALETVRLVAMCWVTCPTSSEPTPTVAPGGRPSDSEEGMPSGRSRRRYGRRRLFKNKPAAR